jgi:phospholipase C
MVKNSETDIKYIIYIMFENHSFHNLFGGFSEYNLPNQLNYKTTSTTRTSTEYDLPNIKIT